MGEVCATTEGENRKRTHQESSSEEELFAAEEQRQEDLEKIVQELAQGKSSREEELPAAEQRKREHLEKIVQELAQKKFPTEGTKRAHQESSNEGEPFTKKQRLAHCHDQAPSLVGHSPPEGKNEEVVVEEKVNPTKPCSSQKFPMYPKALMQQLQKPVDEYVNLVKNDPQKWQESHMSILSNKNHIGSMKSVDLSCCGLGCCPSSFIFRDLCVQRLENEFLTVKWDDNEDCMNYQQKMLNEVKDLYKQKWDDGVRSLIPAKRLCSDIEQAENEYRRKEGNTPWSGLLGTTVYSLVREMFEEMTGGTGKIQESSVNKLCATRTHPKKREETVFVRDPATLQSQIEDLCKELRAMCQRDHLKTQTIGERKAQMNPIRMKLVEAYVNRFAVEASSSNFQGHTELMNTLYEEMNTKFKGCGTRTLVTGLNMFITSRDFMLKCRKIDNNRVRRRGAKFAVPKKAVGDLMEKQSRQRFLELGRREEEYMSKRGQALRRLPKKTVLQMIKRQTASHSSSQGLSSTTSCATQQK